MNTAIKIAAIAGVIGVVALVAVAGSAVASGSMGGLNMMGSGGHMSDGHMNADMGAQCQNGNMATMMNGQGHMGMMNGTGQQCQNAEMQAHMTQNADGTWDCPGHEDGQATA